MNPEDIARLITEDPDVQNEFGFDDCPACGGKFATIINDKISCPRVSCEYYDEEYSQALEALNVVLVGNSKKKGYKYRDFDIGYAPPPIPTRSVNWCACHKDFDGAPDSGDHRCFYGPSAEDVERQVDEWHELNDSAHSW